jgi:spore coat polysaccharide biosynthesis protein SpsF
LKVVAITQARMTSERLPGKIMLKSAGKTLLEHHLERLGRTETINEIVLATTENPEDDITADLGQKLGVRIFRGSEEDVLARYHGAATELNAEIVVRVTSDCPLIDPAVTDRTVRAFMESPEPLDYVSNRLVQTYPRGLDTEVLHFAALDEAFVEATEPSDREHVTTFIWRQPDRYRVANISFASDQSHHRWTVDTPDDFELLRRIIEDLYPQNTEFTLQDCLSLLESHPEWVDINRHVKQREVL